MRKQNAIAESRCIFGDCLVEMEELPAYSFDLVLTDPPYLFTKNNGEAATKGRKPLCNSPLYDYDQPEEVCLLKMRYGREEIEAWLDKTPRLMRRYNLYAFCSDEQIGYYQEWARKLGYKCGVLVWEKPVTIVSKGRWSQNVEFIVRIYENGTSLNKEADSGLYGRVLHYPYLRKKHHPTEKPLPLLENIIRLNSNVGDAVLDPFFGSGSTGVACQRLGRKFVGIERYRPYYEEAAKRLTQTTLCHTDNI